VSGMGCGRRTEQAYSSAMARDVETTASTSRCSLSAFATAGRGGNDPFSRIARA
jgi:hypothetical protein